MDGKPPQVGRVFEKSGAATLRLRARGWLRHSSWIEKVRKRRGRPRTPDEQVAAWAARVEGPEFSGLSQREKYGKLVWDEYIEDGGDPDAPASFGAELDKRAEARRKAVSRWDKKHR
jgi:hypothetical protein